MALFIKNFLEESLTNVYIDAVVRKYCLDEDVLPDPGRPHYLDKRLISTVKLVLNSTHRVSTKDIYNVLRSNELGINEDFKLRIESIYGEFCLSNILELTHSKFIPVCVRSHMWKIIHRIEYSVIEEAKVKLVSPLCKLCGELDIDRLHLYFQCEKVVNIGVLFPRVLKIFNPQYSLKEVLNFKTKEEHLQLNWFIALTLYYLDKNRRKCSTDLYKAFLWSELEVLRRSNKANDDMVIGATELVEMLDE